MIESNIDDLNPQIYEYVFEQLFQAGALDVWLTPIWMKKNRPANQLSVLLDMENLDTCVEIILRETSSIGMRISEIGRITAARRIVAVKSPYGEARAKISSFNGKIVHISAEYQDCKEIAIKTGIPLKKILGMFAFLADRQYTNTRFHFVEEDIDRREE